MYTSLHSLLQTAKTQATAASPRIAVQTAAGEVFAAGAGVVDAVAAGCEPVAVVGADVTAEVCSGVDAVDCEDVVAATLGSVTVNVNARSDEPPNE